MNERRTSEQLTEALDREMKVTSYSLDGYRKAHVLLVGAGAVNGQVGLGLIKKGISRISISDGDAVAAPNLNRQFFARRDIGKPKASTLARNLSSWAVGKTQLLGMNSFIEEAFLPIGSHAPTFMVCCPDNNEAREYTSTFCLHRQIPCVIIGLSDDSDYGYVFVQSSKPGGACWRCLQKGSGGSSPCGVAANINLPMLISGIVLSVCDSLVAEKQLAWNYRRLSLSGNIPDMTKTVPCWTECPNCCRQHCPEASGDMEHSVERA